MNPPKKNPEKIQSEKKGKLSKKVANELRTNTEGETGFLSKPGRQKMNILKTTFRNFMIL
ncbi:MAG: hypothetical protein Ct9H300mP28_03060 [Pseudomonadota bacterium]|nr:MAG: hypothetical protein Ct9H300mP28_03060 [Pseudomonadota bacterium]